MALSARDKSGKVWSWFFLKFLNHLSIFVHYVTWVDTQFPFIWCSNYLLAFTPCFFFTCYHLIAKKGRSASSPPHMFDNHLLQRLRRSLSTYCAAIDRKWPRKETLWNSTSVARLFSALLWLWSTSSTWIRQRKDLILPQNSRAVEEKGHQPREK